MAVPASRLSQLADKAAAHADEIEDVAPGAAGQAVKAAPATQKEESFDVWSHAVAGAEGASKERPADAWKAAAESPSREWARTDSEAVGESLDQQADEALKKFQLLTGQREAAPGEEDPQGFLGGLGATFDILTSLEQMISAPLAMLPFPAFPALRVMDMDIGLPHGHSHPPNLVPPAPMVFLPSTGPIIPIPFLSGASRTLINGLPAARCGDMGLGVWCGGYFPMYEVFLGSSSVWIEGARAGRLLVDVTRHCIFSAPKPQDPPLGPMVGMTITASPNVLIGGVPLPSLLDLAMGAAIEGMFKAISKAVKRAKALRAARKADDEAAVALRNQASPSPSSAYRPRPSHADNMDRLYRLCGGDKDLAMAVRAAARDLVDEMLDGGNLKILDGDAAFEAAVKQDLYMLASSRTGKRQLERILDSGKEVTIRPQSGPGAKCRPRGSVETPPGSRNFEGPAYPDPATGRNGPGAGSDIYYDPNRYFGDKNATPPDAVLNHELGHSASVAEGRCMANEAPSADTGGRFPHLEEEQVIMEVDNAYREEMGLELRLSHAHLP